MAQTKVVIVYSPNQNRRRTVIVPDDDSQIAIHTANIAKGEAVLVGSLSDYQTIGPDAMLAAHTGQQPVSDRCVVVDNNGNVLHTIKADHLIDTHPAGTLIPHEEATAGWRYVNGVFTPPLPSSPSIPTVSGITFYPDSLTTVVPTGLYSQTKQWPTIGQITFIGDTLNIGCQSHLISDWAIYDNATIAAMDSLAATWWAIYKPTIMTLANTHMANCQKAKAGAS